MSARLAEVLYFYALPNDVVMCDGASLEWLKQRTAEAFNILAAEAEILAGGIGIASQRRCNARAANSGKLR